MNQTRRTPESSRPLSRPKTPNATTYAGLALAIFLAMSATAGSCMDAIVDAAQATDKTSK